MSDVKQCIMSIEKYARNVNHECIVISNSCYQEHEKYQYKTELSNCIVIFSNNNKGYAGGVNEGICAASGDFIYILNPDSKLTDSNFTEIIHDMEQSNSWAITGPKVIDDVGMTQPSCRRFPKLWTFLLVRTFLRKFKYAKKEQARYLMQDFDRKSGEVVEWVSGGAMIVKVEDINKCTKMDERYFLYMEDVDWCRSFYYCNKQVHYDPRHTVMHAGKHVSIKAGSRLLFCKPVYWHLTSMIKYFIKWQFRVLDDDA